MTNEERDKYKSLLAEVMYAGTTYDIQVGGVWSKDLNLSIDLKDDNRNEESRKEKNLIVFLLILIVLAAIVGNLLVCLAVYCKRKLRNMFNYFLVSLALSDMMSAIFIMPLSIVKISIDDLPVPKMICVTWYSLDVLFTSSTICHLCMISVDRYLTLTFPLRYGHAKKKKHTLMKIALAWVVSICIAGPLFIFTMMDAEVDHSTQHNKHDSSGADDGVLLKGCGPETPAFVISATVISFYLPLLIMTVMYALTVRALQVQLKERRRIAVTNSHFEPKKNNSSPGFCISPSLKRAVYPDRRKTSAPVLPLVVMRDHQRKLSILTNQALSPYPSSYSKRSLQNSDVDKTNNLSSTTNTNQYFHESALPEMKTNLSNRRPKDSFSWKINNNDGHHHHDDTSCSQSPIANRSNFYGQISRLPSRYQGSNSEHSSPHTPRYMVTMSSAGQEWSTTTKTICDENLFRLDSISADHSFSMLLPPQEIKSTSFINTPKQQTTPSLISKTTPRSSYFDGSKIRRFRLDYRSFSSSFRRRSSITSSMNSSVSRVHGGLDKGRRAVQVLGILFIVFLACYLPFFAIYVIRGTCSTCRPYLPTSILTILEWVAYSAAIFNPIIYHIFNPDFRRAFHQLLRCRCCFFRSEDARSWKDHRSLQVEGSTSSTPLRNRKTYKNYGAAANENVGCTTCKNRKNKKTRLELPTCRIEAV